VAPLRGWGCRLIQHHSIPEGSRGAESSGSETAPPAWVKNSYINGLPVELYPDAEAL
jgi:hypothetical protein